MSPGPRRFSELQPPSIRFDSPFATLVRPFLKNNLVERKAVEFDIDNAELNIKLQDNSIEQIVQIFNFGMLRENNF